MLVALLCWLGLHPKPHKNHDDHCIYWDCPSCGRRVPGRKPLLRRVHR